MVNTLCDTFAELALCTWNTLAEGRSVDHQIGEETLTDLNILKLKTLHGSQHNYEVYSQTFTKRRESLNGSDWEWWFTNQGKNKWIGFRVQAKVIDIKTNSFKHLHYRNSSQKYQCDILIKNALQLPIPRIPLYCLYSNVDTFPTRYPPVPCLYREISYPPYSDWYPPIPCFYGKKGYGCSILSAFAVRYLRTNNTKDFKNLFKYLSPWHCLVCCHGFGGNDLPSRVFRYWREVIGRDDYRILRELSQEDQEIYNQIRLTDNPPNYVLALLNNQLEEQPDENLGTLTVFKESGEVRPL